MVRVAIVSNKRDDHEIVKDVVARFMEKKTCWKWKYLVTGLLSGDRGGMTITPCCRGWLHHAVRARKTPCFRGWFNSLTTKSRGYRRNSFHPPRVEVIGGIAFISPCLSSGPTGPDPS